MEASIQTQASTQTLKQKWTDELLDALTGVLNEAEIEVVRARLTGTLEARAEAQQELDVSRQRIEQIWTEALDKIRVHKQWIDPEVVGDQLYTIASAVYKARLAVIEADNGFDKLCQHHSVSLKPLITTDDKLAITSDTVPTRIFKRLRHLGAKQLGDFSKITKTQLYTCNGIGVGTVAKLERMLLQHGIAFAKEANDGSEQGQPSNGNLAPDGVQRPTEP